MRRRRRSPAVLLALVLSGCSDGGPRAVPAATPTPSAPPASAPPASSPASVGSVPGGPPSGASAASSGPPAAGRARLTGEGLDLPGGVVAFGADVETAAPALTSALGPPTTDTGVVRTFSAYGVCPATQRALTFGGGALVVLFGDVDEGRLSLYSWRLTTRGSAVGLPRASARTGDGTTVEFAVGTTLAALRTGAGADAVEVQPADEALPASFRLPLSGLYGTLSGTGPRDTVTLVQAGQPCGE